VGQEAPNSKYLRMVIPGEKVPIKQRMAGLAFFMLIRVSVANKGLDP
jgi:hypothetical protein